MGFMDLFSKKKEVNNVEQVSVPVSQNKINLIKERETKVGISLAKKTDMEIQARVNMIIDISGSMSSMFSSGKVQEICERLLPIALKLDNNQELDVYTFNNGSNKIKTPVTMNNFEGYISKYINNIDGGTSYTPVMTKVVNDCGNDNSVPVFNIMITDGTNDDQAATEKFIVDVSNKHHFFSFCGIGYSSFSFLEKLDTIQGRTLDNASFFSVNDLSKMSDSDLYDKLLSEFPAWLMQAKKLGIVK